MTSCMRIAIILGATQAVNTWATDLFDIIFVVRGLNFAVFAA